MTLIEFIDKAICVPFRVNGRNYKGWDCWGLFYMAYKDIYGIELPSYRRDYMTIIDNEETKKLIRLGIEKEWHLVDQPKEGDSVIIYSEGRDTHVAMAINREKLIHVIPEINTNIQRLSDYRIEGIYRYNGK